MQGMQIQSLVGELRSHRLWDRHGQKNIHIYNYISTPTLQLSHPLSVAVKMHTAVRFGLGRWPHFSTCEHDAQRTRLRKSFWKKKKKVLLASVGLSRGELVCLIPMVSLPGRLAWWFYGTLGGDRWCVDQKWCKAQCVTSPCVFSHHSQGLKGHPQGGHKPWQLQGSGSGLQQQEQGMSLPEVPEAYSPCFSFLAYVLEDALPFSLP